MLSSCCASVVNLDKRLHEASKPVSSHSLSLDRTQKVPNRQHRFTTLQHLHRCRCAVQHQRSQSAWPDLCLPILHYRSRGTLGVMAFGSIMARALQLVCLLAACYVPATLPRIRDKWTECVVSCRASSYEWTFNLLRIFFSRR
jgi:hypothetical protein